MDRRHQSDKWVMRYIYNLMVYTYYRAAIIGYAALSNNEIV